MLRRKKILPEKAEEEDKKKAEEREKEKRSLNHGSTFEDGLKNQIIVDAVKESSIKRKWIDL